MLAEMVVMIDMRKKETKMRARDKGSNNTERNDPGDDVEMVGIRKGWILE